MTNEKLFENQIKKFFHSVGVYPAGYPEDRMTCPINGWYTKIWGGGYQKSGIPDILACINGIFFAVEVKSSKGKPSELQKLNISRINKANGIGIILYPEGFTPFKYLIQGVINCNLATAELVVLRTVNSSSKCIILTE